MSGRGGPAGGTGGQRGRSGRRERLWAPVSLPAVPSRSRPVPALRRVGCTCASFPAACRRVSWPRNGPDGGRPGSGRRPRGSRAVLGAPACPPDRRPQRQSRGRGVKATGSCSKQSRIYNDTSAAPRAGKDACWRREGLSASVNTRLHCRSLPAQQRRRRDAAMGWRCPRHGPGCSGHLRTRHLPGRGESSR